VRERTKYSEKKGLKPNRYLLADFVRILAALWVSLDHFINSTWAQQSLRKSYLTPSETKIFGTFTSYLGAGYLGVQIFFVISGLAIGVSAQGNRSPHQFFLERLSRIIPTFLILNFFTYLACRNTFDSANFTNTSMVVKSFLLFNNESLQFGPIWAAWTLWIELKFYLIVYFFLLMRKIPRQTLILLIAVIWMAFYLIFPGDGVVEKFFILKYSPFFAIGLLASILNWRKHRLIIFILTVIAVQISKNSLFAQVDSDRNHPNTFLVLLVFYLLIGIVFFSPLVHVFEIRGFKHLSRSTYSFYLMHEPFGLLLLSLCTSQNQPLKIQIFFLVLVAVFTMSIMYEYFIESPLTRFLRTKVNGAFHR
jgi:peptidoglycan/LPS O-acetylase OafA/YrhL